MKKMNNKGFSLVELIIVIAIMAILIAVLAPQYIKYVEKSRKSADLDNYQKVIDAIQVAYADPDANITAGVGADITLADKNNACASNGNSSLWTNLPDYGVDVSKIVTKSSAYAHKKITVSVSGDKFTIGVDDASLAAELGLTVMP